MRHSSPVEILTDNGTEFCNALMDVLAIHMRVKHTTISPYHPQCNGLTERFNRTLCSLIEKNGEYDQYWHMMLPGIIFAYNTSVHSSTNISPFELLYGRKPRLAVAPIPAGSQVHELVDLDRYLDGMLAHRTTLHTHAHENLARAQRSQKEGHDKRVRHTRKFKIGDVVAYRKEKRNEKKGKFRAKYVGPYTISAYDEKIRKFTLVPAREDAEPIGFPVSTFDLQFCYLDIDLTHIALWR